MQEKDDDRTRDAFFDEAGELVDALDRGLNQLDVLLKRSARNEGAEAETINEVFRAVHSLKGISSMFGAAAMATLSHGLEDLLDDLRLGRLALTDEMLHLLSNSVDLFGRVLDSARSRGKKPEPSADVRAYLEELRRVIPRDPETPDHARYVLPLHVMQSFTKYEEHRLRANEAAGTPLYFMHARFPLTSLDVSLADLKDQTRAIGEIISYLPADSGSDGEKLALDVLIATREPVSALEAATAGLGVTIERVPTIGGAAERPEELVITPERPPEEPPSPKPPDPPEREKAIDEPSEASVRVDLKKLDDLMSSVGELASMRAVIARLEATTRADPKLRDLLPELETLRRTFDRRRAEVQNRVLDVRMVPLGQAFERLARIVRQTARERDKDVSLIVTGAETEVDKLIVEALSDPLMDVVRLAIDHGIEDRNARLRAGKPVNGTIALNAYPKGDRVVIDIEDDGSGSSVELGDVRAKLTKLGGTVDVASNTGVGTRIAFTLPTTMAIMSVLVVEVYGRLYCLPIANVEEVVPFEASRVRRTAISQRGVTIPVVWLSALFGDHPPEDDRASPTSRLVIARSAERRVGVVVDRVLDREDVVVKRLGRSLRKVNWLIGAAEVADQRLGFVVDIATLVAEASAVQHR